MRFGMALWCILLCGAWASAGETRDQPAAPLETLEHGQFKAALDPDNLYLPTSIQWMNGGVELLAEKTGLQHSYVSFEFHSKYYREENKHVWAGRDEPRFVTDAKFVSKEPVVTAEYVGLQVAYESSYARVERLLLLHNRQARVRVQYEFQATRDLVVHLPDMFTVGVAFAPGFTRKSVCDVRKEGGEFLTAEDLKGVTYRMSFLNPGPAIATDPAKKLSVLVSGKLSGDLPRPLPSRLLRLNTGQRFGFVIEMECFAEGDAQLGAAMAAKCKAITEAEKPYALTEVGRLLAHQNKAEEAEAAYLRASALDKGYPAAFVCIADLRGVDKKVEGVLSEGEAYAEAAFRMPYNYGFVLRAYVPKGKHLTPEEQRLWTMNRLMAIENTLFYPDYYLWVARDFDGVKAYAQECAMYRQALWAVGRAPYAEKSKETLRKSFAQKIEELEKKVLERAAAPTTPEPPRPTAPTGSPEQLRLALYDRLARLESHALEPEAYAPLVAEFEGLKMYVEACALCRQAIWAVGHTPDPAKYKALSERFQQKIAEFEKHLSEDVSADLPDPIPVRPEKDAPPAAGNAAQTR